MILWADHSNAATIVTTPNGWNQKILGGFHDLKHNAILFYKTIEAGDGSSVTFTTPDQDASTQIIYRIKSGTFDDVTYQADTSSENSNINPPSLNNLSAGKYLIFASGFSHPYTPSLPAGYNSLTTEVSENAQVYAAYINRNLSSGDIVNPGPFGTSTIGETSIAATIGIKGKVLNTYSTEKSIATVLDGHTINITDNATGDTVNVEAGGLLKFVLPNNGNNTQLSLDISSGSPMTVSGTLEAPNLSYISGEGSFTLASGGTFKVGSHYGLTTSSASGTATQVAADVTQGNVRVIGTRSFHPAANYHFNHSGDQETGNTVTTANDVYIESSGLKTLSSSLTVSGKLTLSDGYVISTATNTLTIAHTGTVTGTSDNSFVLGPVKKIGTGAFTFPIGAQNPQNQNKYQYFPLRIAPIGSPLETDAYVAEYHRKNPWEITINSRPWGNSGREKDLGGVQVLSQTEYWNLQRVLGSSNVDLTLYWHEFSGHEKDVYVQDHTKLKIARLYGIALTDIESKLWELAGATDPIIGVTKLNNKNKPERAVSLFPISVLLMTLILMIQLVQPMWGCLM